MLLPARLSKEKINDKNFLAHIISGTYFFLGITPFKQNLPLERRYNEQATKPESKS